MTTWRAPKPTWSVTRKSGGSGRATFGGSGVFAAPIDTARPCGYGAFTVGVCATVRRGRHDRRGVEGNDATSSAHRQAGASRSREGRKEAPEDAPTKADQTVSAAPPAAGLVSARRDRIDERSIRAAHHACSRTRQSALVTLGPAVAVVGIGQDPGHGPHRDHRRRTAAAAGVEDLHALAPARAPLGRPRHHHPVHRSGAAGKKQGEQRGGLHPDPIFRFCRGWDAMRARAPAWGANR